MQRKVVGRKVVLGLESWVRFAVMPREKTAGLVHIGWKLSPSIEYDRWVYVAESFGVAPTQIAARGQALV